MVMPLPVWPLILLFGLLGAFLRGAVLLILFGMLLWFQVLFIFGILVVLVFLLVLLLLRMSVFGRTLLMFWSSWLPSWVLFIGPLLVLTWDLEVSCVELLVLHELLAGERFQFEKAVPRCERVDRPISVSAVPFGPGIHVRRSCRLLGTMFRALCVLPGGLGRFLLVLLVPITAGYGTLVGINLVMVSPPGLVRLVMSIEFLDELLFLFGCPPGSGFALLRGALPLRYCATRFARKVPAWSRPAGVLFCLWDWITMMMECWRVLVLPVLILEEPEADLAFLDLGVREFDFGEKPQFMRFFGNLWEITHGHVFGRD